MKNIKKLSAIVPLCVTLLSGCAAMHTSLSKQDLEIQTRMTNSIFLEPQARHKKTIFVETRNTSGVKFVGVDNSLRAALREKGYTIAQNPDTADYVIQANFLKLGKVTAREADSAYDAGFGGALVGSGIAAIAGGDSGAVIGAGIAGAAVGVAMDALTKDVYYVLVADVRVSEQTDDAILRHQTRIISTANKVNLTFDEAVPELAEEVTASIAGIV